MSRVRAYLSECLLWAVRKTQLEIPIPRGPSPDRLLARFMESLGFREDVLADRLCVFGRREFCEVHHSVRLEDPVDHDLLPDLVDAGWRIAKIGVQSAGAQAVAVAVGALPLVDDLSTRDDFGRRRDGCRLGEWAFGDFRRRQLFVAAQSEDEHTRDVGDLPAVRHDASLGGESAPEPHGGGDKLLAA